MNARAFRLVFSRVLGMFVPTWEGARSHRKSPRHRNAGAAAIAATLFTFTEFSAAQQPAGLIPDALTPWVGASIAHGLDPTTGRPLTDATMLTIQQTQARAILDWQQFNLGRGETVVFDQQGNASWAALNRIHDLNPSVIQGTLRAPGTVYLINANGILFADGARIDTGGLVASTLRIQDQVFEKGVLSILNGDPAFTWQGSPEQYGRSFVRIEHGAEIKTSDGGRVMLFAPVVENSGRVSTPGGQAILAAGAKVYLAASRDARLRGLLVEVDPLTYTDDQGSTVEKGGTVTNVRLAEKIGEILADRGNVTLAGFAVKQQGLVSATTSVSANGSIYLLARDKTVATDIRDSIAKERKSTRAGTLELGESSRTVVLPSSSDGKGSIDSQVFNPSQIVLQGGKIHLKQNAGIVAPGGQVEVTALQNPNNPQLTVAGSPANGSRVFLETGSFIDVSGTESIQVSVARNFVTAELRGNELRDSPLQRGGILEGKTVRFDVRKGMSVGDVSAYIAQVERGVGERTAGGGEITLQSEGDVVVRTGATLDVSGGVLEYTAALVKSTTKLVSGGRVYDIGEATPDRIYQSILESGFQRESGYLEGKDAGSVKINARGLALDGTLLGSAQAGTFQRQSALVPKGGRLVLGDPTGGGVVNADYRLSDIVLAHGFGALPEAVLLDPLGGALGARGASARLSSQAFESGGFSRLEAYSNASILVPIALNLAPGGSVRLQARSISVTENVIAPGGSISIISGNTAGSGPFGIAIGEGARLSTAGSWTNDVVSRANNASMGAIWVDGGNVTLSSVQGVSIGTGAVLDVSGSSWLQQSGKVRNGRGGSIEISTNVNTDPNSAFALDLRGSLLGYAPSAGGAVAIRVGRLQIGGAGEADEFVLAPEFFQQGGFSNYSLSAVGSVTIAADTVIRPQVTSLLLNPIASARPSGAASSDVFRTTVLPLDARAPASVSLAARGITSGNFLMDEGASLKTDIGGSVSFSAGAQLTVLGTVSAPAGKIRLSVTSNPGDSNDPGYVPEQTLWVGSEAMLSAPGAVIQTVTSAGLRTGTVLKGGAITLTANRGAIVVDEGARFDLTGTSATFDLPQAVGARTVVSARTLYGDAGSLRVEAQQAILFDGSVNARAAGAAAASGSFDLILNGAPSVEGVPSRYPLIDRVLTVLESGATVPGGLQPGDALAASTVGQARISASVLRGAGFEEISLTSENRILFAGTVDLAARRRVILDAPIIAGEPGAVANVAAAYVGIGNRVAFAQGTKAGASGSAFFTAKAGVIDLDGAFGVQGFGRVIFDADTDIRLRGILSSETTASKLIGSLNAGNDVEFIAQQVYPTTLSQFTVTLPSGMGSVLRLTGRDGASAAAPLSAGGLMAFSADTIVQGGTLRAPLGEIRLNANERLEFAAGSLTSVSADGLLIPFGKVENGKDWLYDLRNQVNRLVPNPPEKSIQLGAPAIDVAPGSNFDVSGGGDLFAYEFVPGLGGSVDYLAQSGTYAIIPGFQGSVAAFDRQYSTISDLKVGDRITLGGGNGLPAGTYTLLPGHYALLPGAFSVKRVDGFQDITSSQSVIRSDGSAVVSGVRVVDGTGAQENRSSGFLVETNRQVLARAQYNGFRASSFFDATAVGAGIAKPRLPVDAGQLIVAATNTLRFDGDVDFRAGQGGRGGLFDLNAPRIAVVTDAAVAPAGFLVLDAERLNRIGADSILIGGVRTSTNSGTRVDVGASDVVVDNAGTPLVAGEIVLAARQRVRVSTGSAIATASTAGEAADSAPLLLEGDGALLRVADQPGLRVRRSSAVRIAGELDVAANATLTGSAVEFDSTLNTQLASTVVIDAASVGIAASRINFGTVPAGTDGLLVGPSLLSELQSARTLLFRSYSSVDFFGPVALGGLDATGRPRIAELTIDAPALFGHGTVDDIVALTASTFTLSNTTRGIAASSPTGFGRLQLAAPASGEGRILLGQGTMAIKGFQRVEFDAAREVVGQDRGRLDVSGDLYLVAGRIAGATSSNHEINASGSVTLARFDAPLPASSEPGIDARLAVSGATLSHSALIDVPTGVVVLRATQGDLVIGSIDPGSSSVTRVGGIAKRFDQVDRFADAGAITLEAIRGSVIVQGDVRIDVSAHSAGGNAGALSVIATNGTFVGPGFASAFAGTSGSGGEGGRFRVDAASIDDLPAVLIAARAGGFTEQMAVRLRSGDMSLHAQQVKARDIALSVDAGRLTISDTSLDASGVSGGSLRLFADDAVILADGARLVARGTGAGKGGGRLVVGASTGSLDLRAGSVIDVSGGTGGVGGTVELRAPRTGADNDVAIANLGTAVTGARALAIEAVKTYSNVSTIVAGAESGDSLGIDLIAADNAAFMGNANSALGRLGRAEDPTIHLRPGVEIRSSGDLTLGTEWDLFAQSLPDGEPGHLTLRAAGNLLLEGTLSDGFDSAATAALLQSGKSWSYRLVAGADLRAADPLTVLPLEDGASGDVVLAANTLVRTGTGRIEVAARRDFKLSSSTSVLYTAGHQGEWVDGFEDPDGLFTSGFPMEGGDLTVRAGRDVVGVPTTQLVSNWLWRQGSISTDASGNVAFFRNTAWLPRIDRFRDNLGTLGGGDVTIEAGRDLRDLSVMLPTNARMTGTQPSIENLIVQGGGDLSVRAGGDVIGGKYLVARGAGSIEAGGSLLQGRSASASRPDLALYPILFAADTVFDVKARDSLNLEAVVNPTAITQLVANGSGQGKSFFFTYSPEAVVRLSALTGDITLYSRADVIRRAAEAGPSTDRLALSGVGEQAALQVAPPSLDAVAMTGDVAVRGRIAQFPASRGQLGLYASSDIRVSGSLFMSDTAPLLLANPINPQRSPAFPSTRANSLLHAGDAEPVRLVALAGDIVGGTQLSVSVPKRARIVAARDILDLDVVGQNLTASDVTQILAGNDIRFSATRAPNTNQLISNLSGIVVGGPGRVDVVAGHDIDLGSSKGIVSRGNLDNSALADAGASLRIRAGTRPTLDAKQFLTSFPDLSGAAGRDLGDSVRRITGDVLLTDAEARVVFLGLAPAERLQVASEVADMAFYRSYLQADGAAGVVKSYRPEWERFAIAMGVDPDVPNTDALREFSSTVVWPELRASGREAASGPKAGDYSRGFNALARSQLGGPFDYAGDIKLIFSQVKTERGGSIELLAPGGGINVGLATPPAGFNKGPDQLGILSVKGGDVSALVRANFEVNQSRVFTLEGGSILVWSSEGNIDAGRGAKTAVSAPPPIIKINAAGELVVEFPGAASGSGIGVLLTREGVEPGDVDLIAPAGFVNAGDAGIRSSGNVTIAAVRVIGGDNIRAGGASVGVPASNPAPVTPGPVSNVGAEASKGADKATQSAANTAAEQRRASPSFLTVEVVGLGEDDDERKRQR